MSGRLTTERDPSVRGCSGSEMGEIKSTEGFWVNLPSGTLEVKG